MNPLYHRMIIILVVTLSTPCLCQTIDWTAFGEFNGSDSYTTKAVIDDSGNVYYGGWFNGSINIAGHTLTSVDIDGFITKYDANGNFQWMRHISGDKSQTIISIALNSNNQLIATGGFSSSFSFDGYNLEFSQADKDYSDTYLIRLNEAGETLLAKSIGTVGEGTTDAPHDMAMYMADSIVIIGQKGTQHFFARIGADFMIGGAHRLGKTVGSENPGNHDRIAVASNGTIFMSTWDAVDRMGVFHARNHYLFPISWESLVIGRINDLEAFGSDVIIAAEFPDDGRIGVQRFNQGGSVLISNWRHKNLKLISEFDGFLPGCISFSRADSLLYFTGSISRDYTFGSELVELENDRDIVVGAMIKEGGFSWAAKVGQISKDELGQISTDAAGNIYLTDYLDKDSVGAFQCKQLIGQSDKDIFVLKIKPFELTPLDGPSKLCFPDQGTFSFTPISAYAEYRWNIPDAFTREDIDDTHVRLTPLDTGRLFVGIETSADLGCKNMFVNHPFAVHVHPVATKPVISGPDEVCPGKNGVEITVDEAPGNADNCWTISNPGLIHGFDASSLELAMPDDFSGVEILYTRRTGCNTEVSDPFIISVKPIPAKPGEIEGNETLCHNSDDNVFQIAPVEKADYYRWSWLFDTRANTSVRFDNVIEISIPAEVREGSVTVSALNDCGESEATVLPLTILSEPAPPEVTLKPEHACSGEMVDIQLAEALDHELYEWLIRDTDGEVLIETLSNADLFSFDFPRELSVTVRRTNICGESSPLEFIIKEIKDPEIQPKIDFSCGVLSHADDERLTWYWNNEILSNESRIIPQQAGIYRLVFEGACANRETSLVLTEDDLRVFLPNIITPNSDNKNEIFLVSDVLLGSSLTVFDRHSNQIYFNQSYNNDWDASSLATGVYMYVIRTCSNEIYKGTISVRR